MGVNDQELTEAQRRQQLLNSFTKKVISGELTAEQQQEKADEAARKKANQQWHPEGSRPPVHRPKTAGQPTSNSGFPKGKVGTGGSWDAG